MMEKLGVLEEETMTKEASIKEGKPTCPSCGAEVEEHGNILKCPHCGTEPFEKKD